MKTRYKYGLSAAMLALLAAGASAPELLSQFLDEKEGNSVTAYRDNGGIYTICRGITRIDGKPVTRGMQLTPEQCDHYNQIEAQRALDILDKNVKVKLTEPQKAAAASFCIYNIGTAKCFKSTFWRKLNTGDIQGACREIPRWVFDGGKDCRDRKNGCYGQVIRRDQEEALACWGYGQ